ncbi:MAG: SIMPL domain-containing protein [Bacteroidales bacterium]|nr:SIMPL domain-containing protein [Bacteroidales bacterium]
MKGSQIPFKKNYILGTSIVLAALVLGLMMVCMVRTYKSYDNTVKVRGLCEKEVPADRVVLRISYSAKDNSLANIRQTIHNNNEVITNLLLAEGFDAEEIKVSSTDYNDQYTWANNVSNISYRYRASQTISIYTDKLDLVRKKQETIETQLVNHDILVDCYADYQFLGLNDIKPAMIAESLENARTAANEFAQNSHSRTGKMRTASQGYFEIEDLDENNPQIKKIRVVTTVEYYLR